MVSFRILFHCLFVIAIATFHTRFIKWYSGLLYVPRPGHAGLTDFSVSYEKMALSYACACENRGQFLRKLLGSQNIYLRVFVVGKQGLYIATQYTGTVIGTVGTSTRVSRNPQ